MQRRLHVTGALVALAMLGVACKAEISIGGLNVSSLEDSIEEEIFGGVTDTEHDPVSCPDDPDDEAGSTFICTSAVGDEELTIRVTVTEDGADFIREQAILDIGKVQQALSDFLVEQTGVAPATLECPEEIVYLPGDSFTCTATDSAGGSVDLEVVVRNVEGDVDFRAV